MSTVTMSLKGFVSFGNKADNNRNIVAPVGELSAYSRTFARDRELFSYNAGQTARTNVDLTVFSAVNEAGDQIGTPETLATFIQSMSSWLYNQAFDGMTSQDPEALRQLLLGEFDGKITNVTVAPMIDDDNVWMPGSIVFTPIIANIPGPWPTDGTMDNARVRVWFSDDRFRREYDEYSYEFIAPFTNLDDFFQMTAAVAEQLSEVTPTDMTIRTMAALNNQPNTILRTERFHYQDPSDVNYRIPTYWNIVIWGAAGDNIDAIKDRLVEWILDNSTHPREEWARIFPDIFTSTEFVIAPFWSQYAVENMTIIAGVYSPVINAAYGMTVARAMSHGTGYTDTHVDAAVQFTTLPFKSLALAITGGPENRQGKSRLTDFYPDFMNVSTNSPDFLRMSQETRDLVLLLEQMMQVAETMTEFSDIPTGFTRARRTNRLGQEILYLVRSINDIQILVVAGPSMRALFPAVTHVQLDVTLEGVVGVTSMAHALRSQPYSARFEAVGGHGGYRYELVDAPYGALEDHAIDPVTGEYTATFRTVGDLIIRVKATDSSNDYQIREFNLHVYTNI